MKGGGGRVGVGIVAGTTHFGIASGLAGCPLHSLPPLLLWLTTCHGCVVRSPEWVSSCCAGCALHQHLWVSHPLPPPSPLPVLPKVVVANPKTAGVARWIFLALWGHKMKKGEAVAREWVTRVFDNVVVQPRDAREASDVFYRQRLGDVLLTYENEVVLTNEVRC